MILIRDSPDNYYVPPVIFNVTKVHDEQGQTRFKRTCVDGKQRLTSVLKFMRGEIPVLDKRRAKW